MALSERARSNLDELFPGQVSRLAVIDLELVEVFDNFAVTSRCPTADSMPAPA